ncbi:hypothetical protein [Methylobacterium sp. J-092]|uniref:hypothetical protein n=1 Tax=Methylobacterium sp. J-092 TaxID=2836667 RepID=UPI001FBBF64C|nr:hypothetical protein [Methylobacterium sp. J-092]MCJ2008904.1 hypothetical protein [Methylobacterium sp. J-092]
MLRASHNARMLHCEIDHDPCRIIDRTESAMLSVLTARVPVPADEPQDRDPGFLTLAFTVVRVLRREGRSAFERRCARAAETLPHP